MLEKDVLEAAVTRGIISAEQSVSLASLEVELGGEDGHYSGSEEKFRFFKGFNEIFLSVGLLIFIGGLIGAIGIKSYYLGLVSFFASPVIIWLLSEYFVRAKSYVLPGIVLAACFGYFCAMLGLLVFKVLVSVGPILVGELMNSQRGFSKFHVGVGMSLGALIGASAYYLRFKVPFTLFVVATAFVVLVLNLLVLSGLMTSLADSSAAVLVLGISVFCAAMWYDIADPMRKTRSAVCAFWLHLTAAPLIVHAVMSATGVTGASGSLETGAALTIIVFIVILSLVALTIDRRALLVSAFTYFGWAIFHLVETAGVGNTFVMVLTLLMLGGMVLVLGTGWQTLRARLIGPVHDRSPFKYLPPVALQ